MIRLLGSSSLHVNSTFFVKFLKPQAVVGFMKILTLFRISHSEKIGIGFSQCCEILDWQFGKEKI